MDKLKNRWGISSNTQLILILIVFAINGSLSGLFTNPVLNFFGIHKEHTNPLLYSILYIIIISIMYFILLILVSKVFGQSNFFKNFAKKSLSPLGFKRFFE